MATADELLSTIDTDKTLIIDKDLRTIIIPSSVKNLGVESDDDVLRLKFSMPRMYGDVDLSDFSIYINYMNAKNTGDVYVVDDKTIADDTITFSWLVGRVALTYKGNVRFIVCMKKYDNDSNIIQEYNTTIASLPVLEGLETGETIVQQYPDIIEMLLSSSGTTDHSKLGNRDVADQHPISAITGLEEALTPLTGTTETLTPMQVYVAIKSGKSVVLQHTNSKFGLFTFASFNIFEGEKVVVSTSIAKETGGTYLVGSLAGNAGVDAGWAGWIFNATTMAEADDIPVAVNEALAQAKESGEFDGAAGKSAYAYAQDGGYTGTEEQFAAKLAKEKFANPYALTFTGAVNETYDGSSAKTIEIPSGGGGGSIATATKLHEITLEEEVTSISETLPFNPMDYKKIIVLGSCVSTTTNTSKVQVLVDLGGLRQWVPSWLNYNAVQKFHARFDYDIQSGLNMLTVYYSNNYTALGDTPLNFNYPRYNYTLNDLTNTFKVETQNKYLGVGTKFEIWGIK